MDKILVIGGGSWGTAFADYLARREKKVRIWVREKEVGAAINSTRENKVFLPGIELAKNLEACSDLEKEAARADVLGPGRAVEIHPRGDAALETRPAARSTSWSIFPRASNPIR